MTMPPEQLFTRSRGFPTYLKASGDPIYKSIRPFTVEREQNSNLPWEIDQYKPFIDQNTDAWGVTLGNPIISFLIGALAGYQRDYLSMITAVYSALNKENV